MAKKDNIETPAADEDIKRVMPKRIVERFEDLPSDWKEVYYSLAQEGASDVSMYTSVSLTRRKHESLLSITEYKEWFDYCHEVADAWWIDFSKKVCLRKDYNSSTYALVMRNRRTIAWTNNDPKTQEPVPNNTPDDVPAKSLEDFKMQTQTN